MILTDREITISLERGLIVIDPPPNEEAFSSTSVDLTLHPKLRVFKDAVHGGTPIDPGSDEYNYHEASELFTEEKIINSVYILKGNTLVLGWTKERLELPEQSRLAARIEGKSSLSRIGLSIHLTAPTIHAGFRALLQLEILNHGPTDIILRPGMRICQLIFETTLGTPEKGYSGQFQNQEAH